MSIITSVAPGGTISGPLPNAANPQQATLVSAVTGAAPAARSLLPNAVGASNLVPNYNQDARGTRQAQRSSQPSSSFATQLLAQQPDTSDNELAVYERRDQPPQQQQNDAPETPTPQVALVQTPAPVAANNNIPQAVAPNNAATLSNVLAFNPPATLASPRPMPSLDTRPPMLQGSTAGRKPGIANVRGTSAYQLTAVRNALTTVAPNIDTIL